MRHSSTVATLLLTLSAVSAGCATPTGPVPLRYPANSPAALADVRLAPGSRCIVHLSSGEVVRGRFAAVKGDRVELDVELGDGVTGRRVIHQAELDLLARMVTMSKGKRALIGAGIAALLSIPLGISEVGDMSIPAAIAGGVIGRNTGTERAEVVYERRLVPQ
jgi:hypothetical protein